MNVNNRIIDKCGVVFRSGQKVAIVLYDEEKKVPVVYKLEQLGFDELVDLIREDEGKTNGEEKH